jgi:hypothetical protein
MPHLTVPEDTFQRLAARAAALNISVDDLARPALDQLVATVAFGSEPPLPLTGDAWHAELDAWKRDAESRAGRFPEGSFSAIVGRQSTASGKTPNFDPPRHQHLDSRKLIEGLTRAFSARMETTRSPPARSADGSRSTRRPKTSTALN